MRDGQVYAMQEANARRAALLFGQWEFLETRQWAFETVLKCSSLLERIYYVWRPLAFLKAVDDEQMRLLEDGKRKMEAAAQKAKEQAAKPKLTIVGANGQVNGHV